MDLPPIEPECRVQKHPRDFHALCGEDLSRPSHRLAHWLLPLGMGAAALPWTPSWAALLGGVVLALSVGNPYPGRTGLWSKWLLQLSVVGLGAGVNIGVAARVGADGFSYTLVGLLATFAFGIWLARQLGVGPKVGALICAGTAICGGSAIAAAAPAIKADSAETSASLATVFILNALALILFPPIGDWAELSPQAFGLWCALAIHDTSSVTGAALTQGHEALVTATTVKLARALWIIPVAFLLGLWFRRRADKEGRHNLQIPWFIAGFVLLSTLFTLLPELEPAARVVSLVAHSGLTLTLFLIGAGLSLGVIKSVGARPFVHGLLLWIFVGGLTLAAIKTGLIQ